MQAEATEKENLVNSVDRLLAQVQSLRERLGLGETARESKGGTSGSPLTGTVEQATNKINRAHDDLCDMHKLVDELRRCVGID